MLNFVADDSSRLDVFVASQIEDASRSFVSTLCDQGKVSVNGTVIFKTSSKVHSGDIVQVDYEASTALDVPDIDLEILYEDDDCLVVVKPAGVLTHSKGAFNPEATVSTFIRSKTTGMNDNRGGIVHRLDRVTSGLLICAKNEAALNWLQDQFAERNVKKTYMAVVSGTPEQPEAIIEMPIERNPKKPQTFRVGPNGKKAKTQYKVIQSNEKYSLVELYPTTGRTHQLRVHMSEIGHPIVGDVLYGGETSDRTYLHALSLEITLPNKEHKKFDAPLPKEFKDMLS
ncbi:MAG: Pseudouridine synthase [Patescibacteria group bacterium]|nr:Pseudouridine synthase [Patescibacteria group bacterium]